MNSAVQIIAKRNQKLDLAKIEQTLWSEIESNEAMRLHCNESPFDIPQNLKAQLVNKMTDLAWNHYPEFHQTQLNSLIAQKAGLSAENILLGNGSSQLIQQIVNCCSKFLSQAIIENPTFTLYHQACQNERIPYNEWSINNNDCFDLSDFPEISEPSLIILTSPNNPTGAVLPLTTLQTLLEKYSNCIFVVDEAYGEFGGESAIQFINKCPNLLVIKTLSKGFGLPSARFGYVAGSASLIQLLKKYTIPFTINVFTELVVTEFLTNPLLINAVKANQERIKNLRDFVYYLLNEIADETSFKVLPSAANFLMLRFHDVELLDKIKQEFTERNILVAYPIQSCLRLTIGTEVEMSKVIRIIKQIVISYKCKANETAEMQFEQMITE